MAIRKNDSGWLVDIQPGGRGGKRFRKTFSLKSEAMAWEAWVKSQVAQSPEWEPERRDLRTLTELVELWYQHHGCNLRSAADTRRRLLAMVDVMGNPVADRFSAEDFAKYRAQRLESGVTANNMNREHAYLRSVFNELKRLGLWKKENPLSTVRQFKIPEKELSWLTVDQIQSLLAELENCRNKDALLVAKVCLSTGSRWGEAEGLRKSQLRNKAIHFTGTKSGKNRTVPVTESLYEELTAKVVASSDRLFQYCWGAFRDAVERCGLVLPAGQMTHVLRHSFASHFMMNGGNILVLQRILGHQSLTMTMRYAHLAPEHLQEARVLNPLSHVQSMEAV